ncbi:MAG: calcium-binding protein [Planctomycetota bacterium]
MVKLTKNNERENRISEEIIVDAYGPEEQAMGWYYYLEDRLGFPFLATCIAERATSPLRKGDEVEIVSMAPEEECQHEMFVETRWERRTLAVPLSQLKPITEANEDTAEAIEDWHYWVGQGYLL